MDKICKYCKYWGEKKLSLHGKEYENYRLCKKGQLPTYTSAGSSCGEDIKGFKKKNLGRIDKIFIGILIGLYILGSMILIAGTLTYGF